MDQELEEILWAALIGWGRSWSRERLENEPLTRLDGRQTTWGDMVREQCEQLPYSHDRHTPYVVGEFLSFCLKEGFVSAEDRERLFQEYQDFDSGGDAASPRLKLV